MRVRLVRHEATFEARRQQAGTRPLPALTAQDVVVLLDDVRSLWNVGSIFRTADGLGIAHVFLCGITGLPDDAEVHRTALGAEEHVPWSYHAHPFEVLSAPPAAGLPATVVCLERTERARRLDQFQAPLGPLCLVVGNEPGGIAPEVLEAFHTHVEIPMHGMKNSLNVAVAAGIGLYELRITQLAKS